MHLTDKQFAYLLILPSLTVVLGLMLYPLFYAAYLSLHQLILTRPWLGTPFVGFQNYIILFKTPFFWQVIKQTFYFTAVSILLELILALIFALLMARGVKGENIIRGVILLPWMLAPAVAAVIWTWLLNDVYGVINYILIKIGIIRKPLLWLGTPELALNVIVGVDVWQKTPFVFIILLAGLQIIPGELYEAGQIDGASRWQLFRYITIPYLRYFILVAFLLRLPIALRMFDIVYIMTGGGPGGSTDVLATYTYYKTFGEMNIGLGSSLSIVTFLITFIISIVCIKFLKPREGMS